MFLINKPDSTVKTLAENRIIESAGFYRPGASGHANKGLRTAVRGQAKVSGFKVVVFRTVPFCMRFFINSMEKTVFFPRRPGPQWSHKSNPSSLYTICAVNWRTKPGISKLVWTRQDLKELLGFLGVVRVVWRGFETTGVDIALVEKYQNISKIQVVCPCKTTPLRRRMFLHPKRRPSSPLYPAKSHGTLIVATNHCGFVLNFGYLLTDFRVLSKRVASWLLRTKYQGDPGSLSKSRRWRWTCISTASVFWYIVKTRSPSLCEGDLTALYSSWFVFHPKQRPSRWLCGQIKKIHGFGSLAFCIMIFIKPRSFDAWKIENSFLFLPRRPGPTMVP